MTGRAAVAVGLGAGLAAGAVGLWFAYRAARPRILAAIPTAVANQVQRLPHEALPLAEVFDLRAVALAVGVGVQQVLARELP